MKKIEINETVRILELNKYLNEGIGTKIKKVKQKISDKEEVKSLLKTHKQGLKNIRWAQNRGYMDPQVSPGKHTYQKAMKSSELRDVYNHIQGKKKIHVKRVVGK